MKCAVSPRRAPERTLELACEIDAVVEVNTTFPDWAERDDVLRDIRLAVIRLLAGSEDTKSLAKSPSSFVDEVVPVATACETAAA
jgi:hypothetical protein